MTLDQPWFSVHLNNGVDNGIAAALAITVISLCSTLCLLAVNVITVIVKH